ncbi:MAG: MlaD family protein [Xenococcaceae cyanobacterium MO_207.B15]|nr:MlaD family protein [Xenococcaceae cyanobacterium MO_207.B15]
MRSRTIREGSVGLLILGGIALFGGFALWIRGIKFGANSYNIIAEFSDVNGIQIGDSVRYRGLNVGRIRRIRPGINGVDVTMEIDSTKLLIPKTASIQASSSGLIGETFIDIQPPDEPWIAQSENLSAVGKQCNPEEIFCNGDRVDGISGVTLDDLFPLMYELTLTASENPELFENVSAAAKNASIAAQEITKLTKDVSLLIGNVEQKLDDFSDTAQAITRVADTAADQIETTSQKYQDTAEQLTLLASNANELVAENRTNLVITLDNIRRTSESLQVLVAKLDTTIASTDTQKLMANLETLSTDAAAAAANLKDVSATFSNDTSLITLQQTLDSARVTFANAQKITSDLESITGDPNFLNNVRNLINGLSNLVSSTEQLEQEVNSNISLKSIKNKPD